MVLQDALSAAQSFYTIIWSENNFDRFYDKIVTTVEEHNIDQPELPHYLRFQIENGSLPNVFTSAKAYFLAILLKACDLLHCELED